MFASLALPALLVFFSEDGGLGCLLEAGDKRRPMTDMLVWTSLVYCVPSVYGLYAHQVRGEYIHTCHFFCESGSPAKVVFPYTGSFCGNSGGKVSFPPCGFASRSKLPESARRNLWKGDTSLPHC